MCTCLTDLYVCDRERENMCVLGERECVCVCMLERGGGKITDNISWLLFSNPDDRRTDKRAMDAKAVT